ncbi:hypothetical protein NMY22_g8228 [Coprinellus aureogranulatus]|nr:hypothetical protein NMY22_g8228 [Coprinellus aureogranulatus]
MRVIQQSRINVSLQQIMGLLIILNTRTTFGRLIDIIMVLDIPIVLPRTLVESDCGTGVQDSHRGDTYRGVRDNYSTCATVDEANESSTTGEESDDTNSDPMGSEGDWVDDPSAHDGEDNGSELSYTDPSSPRYSPISPDVPNRVSSDATVIAPHQATQNQANATQGETEAVRGGLGLHIPIPSGIYTQLNSYTGTSLGLSHIAIVPGIGSPPPAQGPDRLNLIRPFSAIANDLPEVAASAKRRRTEPPTAPLDGAGDVWYCILRGKKAGVVHAKATADALMKDIDGAVCVEKPTFIIARQFFLNEWFCGRKAVTANNPRAYGMWRGPTVHAPDTNLHQNRDSPALRSALNTSFNSTAQRHTLYVQSIPSPNRLSRRRPPHLSQLIHSSNMNPICVEIYENILVQLAGNSAMGHALEKRATPFNETMLPYPTDRTDLATICTRVSSLFYDLAIPLVWEHLVINSNEDLELLLRLIEDGTFRDARQPIQNYTTRIDFRSWRRVDMGRSLLLLSKLPNIQVLTVECRSYVGPLWRHPLNNIFYRELPRWCPNLRRLHLLDTQEAPTMAEVAYLSRKCKELRYFHVVHLSLPRQLVLGAEEEGGSDEESDDSGAGEWVTQEHRVEPDSEESGSCTNSALALDNVAYDDEDSGDGVQEIEGSQVVRRDSPEDDDEDANPLAFGFHKLEYLALGTGNVHGSLAERRSIGILVAALEDHRPAMTKLQQVAVYVPLEAFKNQLTPFNDVVKTCVLHMYYRSQPRSYSLFPNIRRLIVVIHTTYISIPLGMESLEEFEILIRRPAFGAIVCSPRVVTRMIYTARAMLDVLLRDQYPNLRRVIIWKGSSVHNDPIDELLSRYKDSFATKGLSLELRKSGACDPSTTSPHPPIPSVVRNPPTKYVKPTPTRFDQKIFCCTSTKEPTGSAPITGQTRACRAPRQAVEAIHEDFSRRFKISSHLPLLGSSSHSKSAISKLQPGSSYCGSIPQAAPQHREERGGGPRQLFDHRKDDPVRFSVLTLPHGSSSHNHPTPTPKFFGDHMSASSTSSYAPSVSSSSFTLSSTTDGSSASSLLNRPSQATDDSASSIEEAETLISCNHPTSIPRLAETIHDLLQHPIDPKVPVSIRSIPHKYNIVGRLWTFAFHNILEALRRASFISRVALYLLQDYIYYAYVFYIEFLEDGIFSCFKFNWLKTLNDLARYKMAVSAMSNGAISSQSGLATEADRETSEKYAVANTLGVPKVSKKLIATGWQPGLTIALIPGLASPQRVPWNSSRWRNDGGILRRAGTASVLQSSLGMVNCTIDWACYIGRYNPKNSVAYTIFRKDSMTNFHPFPTFRECMLPVCAAASQPSKRSSLNA